MESGLWMGSLWPKQFLLILGILTTRFSLHEQITRLFCVEGGVRSRVAGLEIR